MKKVLLYSIVLCVNISFAQYTEWHVSTTGTSTGLGTVNSPWDLLTAFSQPSTVVKPGDTVWLHGGVYTGRFQCLLNGTSTNYVTVSSYPGEWAVLNGNIDPFIPEIYSPHTPCAANSQPPPEAESIDELDPTELDDTTFYTENKAIAANYVLRVVGEYVIYKNFEVTCLPKPNGETINRISDPCSLNNGFHDLTGIDHRPISTSTGRCIFANLVVRNISGAGIGSWKYAKDSVIYGCIVYDNGFILRNKNCLLPSTPFNILGKGPGIYTQNTNDGANNPIRKIKNNFIINNYDSGLLVWSADSIPTFDYIKNYDLKDNILLNNGNPGRRYKSDLPSRITDTKPNLIIDSGSRNGFNHPTNINVHENIFYLNSRSSYISGVRVGGYSYATNVSISNNYFFKGTAVSNFANGNVNLSFKNNFYLGKRIQIYTQPSAYGTNNWDLNMNTWYSRDIDGAIPSYPLCYQDETGFRRTLVQFSSAYPVESDQLSSSYRAKDFTSYGKYCLKSYSTTSIPDPTSPLFADLNKIVQNEYDSNKFYVTLNNPTLAASRNVLFTAYNIPNGKYYSIRDPQNYFVILRLLHTHLL